MAVKTGYEAIAVYRGVLVTARRNDFEAGASTGPVKPEPLPGGANIPGSAEHSESPSRDELLRDERQSLLPGTQHSHMNGNGRGVDVTLKMQIDQDIDELIALRKREELEEMYGVPFIVRSFVIFLTHISDAGMPSP